DWQNEKKVFLSSYLGDKKEMKDSNLIYYFFKYPLITLRVILLIHWQAMILLLKKVPFYRKMENQELQRGVYVGKSN
ncbi:MAG: DUF1365 family protein, partial [Spirochaetia bacterium]|nr:DUF1365 family protein [Spirochaetia bacterium]